MRRPIALRRFDSGRGSQQQTLLDLKKNLPATKVHNKPIPLRIKKNDNFRWKKTNKNRCHWKKMTWPSTNGDGGKAQRLPGRWRCRLCKSSMQMSHHLHRRLSGPGRPISRHLGRPIRKNHPMTRPRGDVPRIPTDKTIGPRSPGVYRVFSRRSSSFFGTEFPWASQIESVSTINSIEPHQNWFLSIAAYYFLWSDWRRFFFLLESAAWTFYRSLTEDQLIKKTR